MLTSRECRRRHVLASLVPVKARHSPDEISLTDYGTPSALILQHNQTPDDGSSMPPCHKVMKVEALPNLDIVTAGEVMNARIEDTQQQWISHQHERFRIQLQRSETANPPRQLSLQSPDEPQVTSQHVSLRQLDHIGRLLRTAGESLPSSAEASDCLVATQCYAMALAQLAAMLRALESQSAG